MKRMIFHFVVVITQLMTFLDLDIFRVVSKIEVTFKDDVSSSKFEDFNNESSQQLCERSIFV